MNLLHLSDLHFGTHADTWYSQLAGDLKNELGCQQLDALILSGDIANQSTPEEYAAARQFLKKLADEFRFDLKQTIIVPGNHDLNWDLAEKAYDLKRRNEYDGPMDKTHVIVHKGGETVEVQNPGKYKQRFKHFSDFYGGIKGDAYPAEYAQQGILHHFPQQRLLILALNSAWQLDHHYTDRAGILAESLNGPLDQIRQNPEYAKCRKFAVWHHPHNKFADSGFMQRLAQSGFSVAFHGHIHKAETGAYQYDHGAGGGRRIHIVCAGTFGAPTRDCGPGYPLQYNFLKLEDDKLIVETRRREEINGAWKPDARWLQGPGKDPLPRYVLSLFMPSEEDFRKIENDISQLLEDSALSFFHPLLQKLLQWSSIHGWTSRAHSGFHDLIRQMHANISNGHFVNDLLEQEATPGNHVQPEWDVQDILKIQANGNVYQILADKIRDEIKSKKQEDNKISIVLLVMNADEAQALKSGAAFQKDQNELHADFEQLQKLLDKHGIGATWIQNYKNKPEEWQPFSNDSSDIKRLLERALNLVEHPKLLVPEFVDIRNLNNHRSELKKLREKGCVVIMDILSMRHPDLQRDFRRSLLDAFPHSLVASIPPIPSMKPEESKHRYVVFDQYIDLEVHKRCHRDDDDKCRTITDISGINRLVKTHVPSLLPDKPQTGSRKPWWDQSGN